MHVLVANLYFGTFGAFGKHMFGVFTELIYTETFIFLMVKTILGYFCLKLVFCVKGS